MIQELGTGDPSLSLLAAHVLVETKQFHQAITLYESILKMSGDKNDDNVLKALARVHYIVAKTNKDVDAMKIARKYIQRAVHINPFDKANFFNMALLEQQMASTLNEQSLENRSVEAMKAASANLDLATK